MFTVRLENIKIRQDLSNDEVAKIAYTKFNIPQESVTDYKIVKSRLMQGIRMIFFTIILLLFS